MEKSESTRREVATLGGGCFWCIEAVFSLLKGVEEVDPGYAGGTIPNPTYEQVSTGSTGHAEVAQITFNPDVISFKEILEIFFSSHDPTTLNRQGPDAGTQYRSIILYNSEEQRATARQVMAELANSKKWKAPIVTQVKQLRAFYKAEDYHREYYKRHPSAPYCQAVIAPKIEKIEEKFALKIRIPKQQ
jgi:peptide-methionine (S)-S-oxide reductase